MGLICACPKGDNLKSMPNANCKESFGQIQKVVFQRVLTDTGTKNAIADPTVIVDWTPLLAAVNSTKVVQSPYIQAPTTEPGAARTYGGGNETLGGVELTIGREPTAFSGNLVQIPQKTIKVLKEYQCENVGVYLVDEYGNIGCIVDDVDTPTEYYPIKIQGLFVGDKTFGGLEGVDMNAISWKMLANWSDNFVIVKPTDFNALTDLVNP